MRNEFTLRGLFVPLGLVALATCVTDPAEFVETVLIASDSIVSSSDPIEIEVVATNVGTSSVQVDAHGCPQLFMVMDAQGVVVGPEPVACLAVLLPPRTLLPGESLGFSYSWSGGAAFADGVQLPEGQYQVRGWVLVVSGGQVYTNTLDVRVIDILNQHK